MWRTLLVVANFLDELWTPIASAVHRGADLDHLEELIGRRLEQMKRSDLVITNPFIDSVTVQ